MSKVALITGSSRGIGKEIAINLAKNGYAVIINCKSSKDELIKTFNEIKLITNNVLYFICDISSYEQSLHMYQQIKNKFGKIDLLINNAGISYVGLFNKMSILEIENIININLKGAINLSHIVIEDMIKLKQGNIINISSIWGNVGASCEVIYSATKGAINSFTRALAKEVAPSNIKVNCIACGAIETSMNDFLTPEEKILFQENIPLMRFGTTKEVSDMVLFLASEKSSYLTGQVITLDGGFL